MGKTRDDRQGAPKLDNRTNMCRNGLVNDREFLRRARRYARKHRLTCSFAPSRGKGSHGEVRLGPYRTTVPHGEIPTGTLASMLKDLHIDRGEL